MKKEKIDSCNEKNGLLTFKEKKLVTSAQKAQCHIAIKKNSVCFNQ